MAAGVADVIVANSVSSSTANGYGIFVFVPYIAPAVSNNIVTNVDVGMAFFGRGTSPITTTFGYNTLDGASRAKSVGVFVTTDQLGFGANSTTATIVGNDIQHFSEGIHVDETGGITATVQALLNRIINDTTGRVNACTTTIAASNNWWGNYGPAATGSGCSITTTGVTGSVTTSPWMVLDCRAGISLGDGSALALLLCALALAVLGWRAKK